MSQITSKDLSFMPLYLGPDTRLSCETVENWASPGGAESQAARLTPNAQSAMTASRSAFRRLQAKNTPIYGTTTGFGPLVAFGSGDNGSGGQNHGASLLAHLGAGWGMAGANGQAVSAPSEPVRAAVLIRAQNLAQGWSGVDPDLVCAYVRVIEAGITPLVPPIGSVGASGDLVPLSHIARVFAGQPDARAWFQNREWAADAALDAAGLSPAVLEGRDALALTNGTSFLTAYAALAVARAERLVQAAEAMTGWMYRLVGARASALDPRLHEARGHEGQKQSAHNIAREAGRFGDVWENEARALQEIYSLRCAPQVLGACRENLGYARRIVETEINGASDNPLFCPGEEADGSDAVLHGGNFHGQQVAFAADALNAALTQIAVLVERQTDLLVTPSRHNDFAPLLLAWEPGATSGLAGAQITATALVAEMRAHAQHHATLSMPTNGNNQDVVSMGALAARMAFEQAERLSAVIAIGAIAASQLYFLRQNQRAEAAMPLYVQAPPPWMPAFEGLVSDRPLRADIERIAGFFLKSAT